MLKFDHADVQGPILYGYGHLPFCACLWVAFEARDKAAAWLGQIAPLITSAADKPRGERGVRAANIAFTAPGLTALGVNAATLQTFSTEFQEGMADANRARFNGDAGDSAPERWELGGPSTPAPHAVLMLFTRDGADREAFVREEVARMEKSGGVRLLQRMDCEVAEDKREHFGFRDGVSQPKIEGVSQDAEDATKAGLMTKLGDFVLGYPDGYGNLLLVPRVRKDGEPNPRSMYVTSDARQEGDLGFNGSYMVFRKLHQDVAGFHRYAREQSRDANGAPDPARAGLFAAKMMGRWPSGASLVEAPEKDNKQYTPKQKPFNQFLYRPTDPYGNHCPVGSHVRRANPRDALEPDADFSLVTSSHHRLLRRGRPYGPRLENPEEGVDDGVDRGLLFICFSTSVQRQFEMVQQLWINSYCFNDLYNEADVITGDSDGSRVFSMPGAPFARRLEGIARFVTVKGGAYCFMPSLKGLEALRKLAAGGG